MANKDGILQFKNDLVAKIKEGVELDKLIEYIENYKNVGQCVYVDKDGVECHKKKKKGQNLCSLHYKEYTLEHYKTLIIMEIEGIMHYVDDKGMVYSTEDVLNNALKPRIIGTFIDGVYETIKTVNNKKM
jgi:hypothetical protein